MADNKTALGIIGKTAEDTKEIKTDKTMIDDKNTVESHTDSERDNTNTDTNKKTYSESLDRKKLEGKAKGLVNLIPINERTPEEQFAIRSKGGKANSAKVQQRKSMRDNLDYLLRKSLKAKQKDAIQKLMNMSEEDIDNLNQQDLILVSMIIQAQQGDVKAAQYVRDTVGEMPTIKQDVNANIMTEGDRTLFEKISKRLDNPADTDTYNI